MAKTISVKLELVDELTRELKKTTNNVKTSSKSMMTSMIKAQAVIQGFTKAWQVASRVVSDSLKVYTEQVKAEAKLEQAIRATGGAAGITAEEMKKMAKEMQAVTTFGDEAVIGAQSLLTTFTKIGKDVFPQAIMAAADMSEMFGQDLQQSVIQLGTALNDPITGVGRLRRIGISFSESQKDQIRQFVELNDIMSAQKVILDELAVEFGGVAKAVAETDVGRMQQETNKLGDSLEELGKSLLPFARIWKEELNDKMSFFVGLLEKIEKNGWLSKLQNAFRFLISPAKVLALSIGTINEVMRSALVGTLDIVNKAILKTNSILLKFASVPGVVGMSARGMVTALSGASKGISEFRKSAQEDLEIAQKTTQILADDFFKNIQAPSTKPKGKGAGSGSSTTISGNTSTKADLPPGFGGISTDFALQMASADFKIYEENEKKKTELLRQEGEERKAIMQTYASVAAEIVGLTARTAINISNDRNAREKRLQIEAINNSKKSEKEKQKEIMRIEKEDFERRKRLSIVDILISGAMGAAKTVANVGFPAAIPLLVLQAATTAAALATAASQKFAGGGIVGGNSFSGDNVNARVNSGEMILNNRQIGNLFKRIDNNQLGGGEVRADFSITVQGNITGDGVEALKSNQQEMLDQFFDRYETLRMQGKIA